MYYAVNEKLFYVTGLSLYLNATINPIVIRDYLNPMYQLSCRIALENDISLLSSLLILFVLQIYNLMSVKYRKAFRSTFSKMFASRYSDWSYQIISKNCH